MFKCFLFSNQIFLWKPQLPKLLAALTIIVNKIKTVKLAIQFYFNLINLSLKEIFCVIPSIPVSLENLKMK